MAEAGTAVLAKSFSFLDKYCRQALPELKSNRTKIKKHYVPKKERIEYVYLLKWNLKD